MNATDTAFFSSGCRIAARLRRPADSDGPSPAVVINHGYSGDMNEYDAMAEYLCAAGYATLQFDSRGCGNSSALKGRMMCATEWIEDAQSAVSYVSSLDGVDSGRIGFTGCSMGGAVTVVMAALDERIRCAVSMSPMTGGREMLERNWTKFRGPQAFARFMEELREDSIAVVLGQPSRVVSVPYALGMNMEDAAEYLRVRAAAPDMVSHVPLESVRNSFLMFEPLLYAPRIRAPFLGVHGAADEIVPIGQSERLVSDISGIKEFVVIRDGPHPLPMSDKAPTVFALARDWFDRYLA